MVGIGKLRRCIWLFVALTASSETIHYVTLPGQVIEKRLAAFRGANAERQRTLRSLFGEAGCSGDHLNDQSVKGSRTANLICIMPGETESAIIAGAHFDYVDKGTASSTTGAAHRCCRACLRV